MPNSKQEIMNHYGFTIGSIGRILSTGEKIQITSEGNCNPTILYFGATSLEDGRKFLIHPGYVEFEK